MIIFDKHGSIEELNEENIAVYKLLRAMIYILLNELMKPKKKSLDEIAKEVIQGKWSIGTERARKLTAAGYDYVTVQRRVNEILKK